MISPVDETTLNRVVVIVSRRRLVCVAVELSLCAVVCSNLASRVCAKRLGRVNCVGADQFRSGRIQPPSFAAQKTNRK